MLQMDSKYHWRVSVNLDYDGGEDYTFPEAAVVGWVYENGLVLPVVIWKGWPRVLQPNEFDCPMPVECEVFNEEDVKLNWTNLIYEHASSAAIADMPRPREAQA